MLPSDRFYHAVVAASDVIAAEGGTITFMFATVRPPPQWLEDQPSPSDLIDEDANQEAWQDGMLSPMDQARELLYERGVADKQVLSRGELVEMPDYPGTPGNPFDIAAAVQELADDGVKLLVA